MRSLLTIAVAVLVGSLLPACSDAPGPCDDGSLFCGTGGTGGTGTGGTGGGCTVAECPQGNDCQSAVCTSTGCGLETRADGATCGVDGKLQCSGGKCQGCTAAEQCNGADCNAPACDGGTCGLTPDGALTCAGGQGSCNDQGVCGRCDDGVQNGDESGVDCGDGTTCGKCGTASCGADAECASGSCKGGICCSMACDGACMACSSDLTGVADGVCAPTLAGNPSPECDGRGGCGETPGYCKCDDGVKNGDEADIDCGGSCGETCGDGATCLVAKDCVSSLCADGLCCNTACDGACEACNAPEHPGLCFPVAAEQTDPQCAAGLVCSTDGGCAVPIGMACASDAQCASNHCPGATGKCAACANDAECGDARVCIEGACFSKAGMGESCLAGKACSSGFCVDGVCCESACTGLCMACHNNYTAKQIGTCAPILGTAQGFEVFYDPNNECPQPDPSKPAPGGAAACSGAPADAAGNSSCGTSAP